MKYFNLCIIITLLSCTTNYDNNLITIINDLKQNKNDKQHALLKWCSQSRGKSYYEVLDPIKSHLTTMEGNDRAILNVFKISDSSVNTLKLITLGSEILDDESVIIILVFIHDVNIDPEIDTVQKLLDIKKSEYKIVDVKFALSQNLNTKFKDKFNKNLFYNEFD